MHSSYTTHDLWLNKAEIWTIEVGDPKNKFSRTCEFAKSVNTLNFKENELISLITPCFFDHKDILVQGTS